MISTLVARVPVSFVLYHTQSLMSIANVKKSQNQKKRILNKGKNLSLYIDIIEKNVYNIIRYLEGIS